MKWERKCVFPCEHTDKRALCWTHKHPWTLQFAPSAQTAAILWNGRKRRPFWGLACKWASHVKGRKFKSCLLYSKQVASLPSWGCCKNECHLLPGMESEHILHGFHSQQPFFMRFYLQNTVFVFPRSLVCNIFIHDTNYFICIRASDLDLNLPEIFSCGICCFIYIHR